MGGAYTLIDRKALVGRHDVVRTALDEQAPLQVGNGRFAFGMDVTGLQTLVPFATMSDWGWHSTPPPPDVAGYRGQAWDTHGRQVVYPHVDPDHPEASQWLIQNPHRLNLGQIGFTLPGEPSGFHQRLDLWTGIVTSHFMLRSAPVDVITCCHPDLDAVGVSVRSPLLGAGDLAVFWDFPYGDTRYFAPRVGDWDSPGRHRTEVERLDAGQAVLRRTLDDDAYHVTIAWEGGASFCPPDKASSHRHLLRSDSDELDFVCLFSPAPPAEVLPTATEVAAASARRWPEFWESGGAIDFGGCTDPRAPELERRVVLSQYVMAVNEAGSLPPQESGLVNNGWHGKFHFEMYLWHAAHWALWDRWPVLRRSLDVYRRLLPAARERAAGQGFRGARWPKCTGPEGRETPGEIHALLVWQQPHVFFFAELDYRAHPSPEALERWAPVLDATADFLASYAHRAGDGRYVLGPPVHVVSENTKPAATVNPAFELAYWRFGLAQAQLWRERRGLPRDEGWDEVLSGLSEIPIQDGAYVLYEGVERMWEDYNFEHPALTGMYGLLPGPGVDEAVMRHTVERILATWRWDKVWGWDFPMVAMCMARLGRTADAIDFLLHDSERFHFTDAGLAAGGPFPYFPSNGGLLYAVAMLCAGWEGGGPSLPAEGWDVRWEGLRPAL